MSRIEQIESDLADECLKLAIARDTFRTPATTPEQAQYRADVVDGLERSCTLLQAALHQARIQAQYGFPL